MPRRRMLQAGVTYTRLLDLLLIICSSCYDLIMFRDVFLCFYFIYFSFHTFAELRTYGGSSDVDANGSVAIITAASV